jgi:diacylglycerol kinase
MTNKKNNGFRASFGNAFTGFTSALRTERNLKIHFTAGIAAILVGFYLQISLIEWGIILVAIAMVIISELFNTAVECTVDLISPHENELARKAKDISASAVLTAAACSVVVGLVIFLPKLIRILQGL